MREAGEVVCLKVFLGRYGEGMGGNAVREVAGMWVREVQLEHGPWHQ